MLYEMGYCSSRKLWRRMHHGIKVEFRCRKHDIPPGREAGRQRANELWRDWLEQHHANSVAAKKKRIFDNLVSASYEKRQLMAIALMGTEQYEHYVQPLSTFLDPPPPPKEPETVILQVRNWLHLKSLQIAIGKNTPNNFNQQKIGGYYFAQWIGHDTPVEQITETTVRNYYEHLVTSAKSNSWRKHRWCYFQQILEFIRDNLKLPMPTNLNHRDFKFGHDEPAVDYWTPSDWQAEYAKANDVSRLVMCLAANCGMYASDMSRLPPVVDGTITYFRHKIRNKSKAVVTYNLWQETIDLLAKCGFVLRGQQDAIFKDGKVKQVDTISRKYSNFGKNVRFLRHTSAHACEQLGFRHYKEVYLNHARKGLGDTCYSHPIVPRECTDALRQYYFGTEKHTY